MTCQSAPSAHSAVIPVPPSAPIAGFAAVHSSSSPEGCVSCNLLVWPAMRWSNSAEPTLIFLTIVPGASSEIQFARLFQSLAVSWCRVAYPSIQSPSGGFLTITKRWLNYLLVTTIARCRKLRATCNDVDNTTKTFWLYQS